MTSPTPKNITTASTGSGKASSPAKRNQTSSPPNETEIVNAQLLIATPITTMPYLTSASPGGRLRSQSIKTPGTRANSTDTALLSRFVTSGLFPVRYLATPTGCHLPTLAADQLIGSI